MSRLSHLPPRCPPTRALDSTKKDDANHLIKFPSESFLLEEQPSWLADLFTDFDNSSSKEIHHRRSASDSEAIHEVPSNLHCPISPSVERNLPEIVAGSESCGFEVNCVYGPNSPRQKSKLSSSESSMVTALLESVPQNPLQYVGLDDHNGYGIGEVSVKRDFHMTAEDNDAEKAARRRSGQRSRVRKLQYIAELERTVDVFQTLGAELAARVAALFQQRVALSVENKKLRQQIASLRQDKMIKDGQYQSMKNEAERLKVICGHHRRSKSAASCFEMATVGTDRTAASWQMLDIGKLNLGGEPIPLRHGSGRRY